MPLTKQHRKRDSNLTKTRRENSKPLGVLCETLSSIQCHCWWFMNASSWVAWSCVPLLQGQSISPMLSPYRQKVVCVQVSIVQPCIQARTSPRAACLFRSLLLDLYINPLFSWKLRKRISGCKRARVGTRLYWHTHLNCWTSATLDINFVRMGIWNLISKKIHCIT